MVSQYSPLSICKSIINFISSRLFGSPSSSRDPEIKVDFRHSENDSRARDRIPEASQKGPEKRDEHGRRIPVQNQEGPIKGPRKSVTIKEDRTHGEAKSRPGPRHWGPLLSVASNINDKCEAFISSRKRAMRRNYTQDGDKS